MSQKRPLAPDFEKAEPVTIRNPYILNFCKILVEQKGEKHEPEALKKLVEDMYGLYENMLGQKMVKALPEDIRKEYLALSNDLSRLNYEKIADIFYKHVPNYEEIMKDTLKEFKEIFMKNRDLSTKECVNSFKHPDTEAEKK